LETARGRDYLGDLGLDGRKILIFLEKQNVRVWTGFKWLFIRSNGEVILTR
jgi:hypothetical protein